MDRPETAVGPTAPRQRASGGAATPAPLSTLRGARIEIDGRRIARAFCAAGLVALTVLAIAFFIIGAHKNAQIAELREHGSRVEMTVTSCRGLMGGSGSNPVGYACTGSFTLKDHQFDEAIPGSTLYGPGTKISAIAADDGSGLFTLPRLLEAEHASWRVYILPSALVVVIMALLGGLVLRRRTRREI